MPRKRGLGFILRNVVQLGMVKHTTMKTGGDGRAIASAQIVSGGAAAKVGMSAAMMAAMDAEIDRQRVWARRARGTAA